ncbi:hypothetical protein ACFYT4_31930 [Streptomyces sp. NPDC004609]|uniref:hypothetical protein n=1 Tax=Streptomyces sp. NPDC004609 TaxID=3364704 RepID=UPI003678C357
MGLTFGNDRTPGRFGVVSKCAALGLVAAMGVSGCTRESKETPTGSTASEICQATLDTSAAAALKEISGTDRFTESPGEGTSGEKSRFSLEKAADGLHKAESERSSCVVYKADGKSDTPLIEVDFEASLTHPDSREPVTDNPDEYTYYPIGVYAATKADLSASLYFRCPTKGGKGNTPYVKAGLFSPGRLVGDSTSKERMTVLNAIARKLAGQLGCATSARLPAEVPEPVAPR